MTTVYSFDVFDTCLVRTFARPEDLFIELARRLLPAPATPEQITDFARQREQAETAARRATTREDITLADIYHYFTPALADWGLSPQGVQAAEVNLEISAVRPVWAVQQHIAQLRRQGRRIIFISDMVLPTPVIRLMLVNRGLARPTDPVYVSGDIGLTKASGRLFDYVLAQEGISPAQLHHYGDNPQTDVISARRCKIGVTFFHQSQLNRFERQALQSDPNNLHRSPLAGISRAVRLSLPAGERDPDMLTGVVAPLLTAFVAWVLRDANRQGLQRLYFVSRDGQILYKIATELTQHFSGPKCRYLYGSRQAWLLPSITVCNRQALDWLMLHDRTPFNLLKKLAIEPTQITPALQRYHFDSSTLHCPLTPTDEDRFWQMIESPDVAELVLGKAASVRQTVLAYFAQEQLTADGNWALVDVGWAARGQRAIRQILRTQDPHAEVRGYYLAMSDDRRPITETGPYRVFVPPISTQQFDSPGRVVLNNTMLFEHLILLADHGTVVSYHYQDEVWSPVLKELPPHPFLRRFIPRYQHIVLSYVSEVARSGLNLADLACWQRAVLTTTHTFISRPTLAEAQLAAQLPVVVDQTHAGGNYHFLARMLTLRDVIYIWRYALTSWLIEKERREFAPGYAWLEGSLALSPRWIQWMFRPIILALQFQKKQGRRRIFNWLARLVAKEKL